MRHVTHQCARVFMILAKDQNTAFRGLVEAGNHAQESGFAGSIFTAQNVEPTRVKIKGDVPHCSGAAINFGDVLNLYGNSRGSQRRTSITFTRRLCGRAILRGCVFGRALGLKLVGMENSIFAEIANGKRLRIVFEGVRRWF